jgi:hypothetical protein
LLSLLLRYFVVQPLFADTQTRNPQLKMAAGRKELQAVGEYF